MGQPTRRKLANALQQEINIAECLLFNALLKTENLAVDFMDVSDLDTCLLGLVEKKEKKQSNRQTDNKKQASKLLSFI